MKKLLAILLALTMSLSMVACGKEEKEKVSDRDEVESIEKIDRVDSIDNIRFNDDSLAFPCKVKELLDAVDDVGTIEEDLSAIVEPGETKFCSIFDYNNTSFGVMNLSDSAVAVEDCYVVFVTTSISLSDPSFDVVYPGEVEYGKEFDKEEVYEILGEPSYTNTNSMGEYFQFEQMMKGKGNYEFSLTVLEDGTVGDVTLMVHPEVESSEGDNEAVEDSDSEEVTEKEEELVMEEEQTVEEEPTEEKIVAECMDNKFVTAFRLESIIYDESGLPKSEEELTMALDAKRVEIRTRGVKINVPGNIQDFLNINSAAKWNINGDTIPAQGVVNYTLPYMDTTICITVTNPTDKEISSSEGLLTSLTVNTKSEIANELDSFAFEFPANIFLGTEIDIDKLAEEFGNYLTLETPERIEYSWVAKGIGFNVNVDKETNLVDRVDIISYDIDAEEYAEPMITEPTPYVDPWDDVNVVNIDVQSVANGGDEEKSFYIGEKQIQLPCTVQELMEQTGLSLPEEYKYTQIMQYKYMENIPLCNEDGVKCLEIKAYCGNPEYSIYISSCTLFEVAQPVNVDIPAEYQLKTE